MLKKLALAALINCLSVVFIFGQSQISLDELLNKAERQTANYQETFRNLLALETKIFEEFNKEGQTKKQNTVESNFLVYQSSKNPKAAYELRNILKVDGKPIPNSQENADKFFEELGKSTTLKSELEKIEKAGSKYDKSFDISGLTLYEGAVLSNNIRPYFQFNVVGKDTFAEKEVYLVSYQQVRKSPFVIVNGKSADQNSPSYEFSLDIPGKYKNNDIFLRGKFWIDASTFQIWREERELYIQANEPLVLLQTTFDYQPSNYDVLLPLKIIMTSHEVKKVNGKDTAVKDMRVNFEYANFRKTETDVKILDDEN